MRLVVKRVQFAPAQRDDGRIDLTSQTESEICDLGEMVEPEDGHTVDQVMRRWPCTISVFIAHHLRCVGCALGRHHTVGEACRAHGVEPEVFMDDVRYAIEQVRPEAQLQPMSKLQSAEVLPSAAISSL